MNDTISATTSRHDALELRHVLAIVLVGAALGLGFNALQLASNPSRALPWLKSQRRIVTLEQVPDPGPAATAPPGAAAAPAGEPGAPAPQAPSAVAGRDTTRKAAPKGTKGAAAPATGPATSPAPAATAPVPAAAAPAPAADLPAVPDSRDPMEVGVDVVKKFYAAGAAVFIDARSAEEYAEGHIAGAVNLPFDDVFKNPALARSVDAKGRVLITYCSGGDCDLSRSLAFSLIDAGHRKVLVFTGGVSDWAAGGGAVHKGAQP